MSVTIRQAEPEDIFAMVTMINGFAEQNLMLPRTAEAIRQSLPDWLVAENQGKSPAIVGCGALAALTEQLAEIRSLAIHTSQQGQGLGSRLVVHLIEMASAREFEQVCALTLRESFFVQLGFVVVDRWSISPKLWQECIYCPKFHRCDEVAVLKNLGENPVEETTANTASPAAWNSLLKWRAWQPLKLAYNRKPIHLEEE